MRLMILSRYDRLGASSRLRLVQYLPFLAAAGITAQVLPFFDDAYLERLYGGQRIGRGATHYYRRRWAAVRGAGRPDAIWLEKEALPWLPFAFERRLLPHGVPMVSDYDDAVFHRYDRHRNPLVRRVLGDKIDRVMAHSALVLAGNSYLATRARIAGAPRVAIVPTVVDADSYAGTRLPAADGRPRIGWIGTPSTWDEYMRPLLPLLTDLARTHGAVIRNVGGGGATGPQLETLPWSEATESRLIQGMDIGLMPLDDSPWSQGKCGYKLIQYMACGLPVVASPVGVNSEIVEHGVNGFLATTEQEWRAALQALLEDRGLRQRMGAAGRQKVEEHYSLKVWGPRVADLLRSVVAT